MADRRPVLEGPPPLVKIGEQAETDREETATGKRLLVDESGRERDDTGILQGRLHQVGDRRGAGPIGGLAEGDPGSHRAGKLVRRGSPLDSAGTLATMGVVSSSVRMQ